MTLPRIISIADDMDLLIQVKRLSRINSQNLGFFPDGAFEDHAQKGWILVAVSKDSDILGFLTYRIAKNRCSIVHLCVAKVSRGAGIAKQLVENLEQRLDDACFRINARCRRDYVAHSMWPKLGFIPVNEQPGRSKDRLLVVEWRKDLARESLFSHIEREKIEQGTAVVIDAQIFYDLEGKSEPREEQSRALLADWLGGDISIFLTDEIFNEIDRNKDPIARSSQRNAAKKYSLLPSRPNDIESALELLTVNFGKPASDRDRSDFRQVAHSIAGQATIFTTFDEDLLKKADRIYELSGLNVVSPLEVVARLEELQDDSRYRPARLAGTSLEERPLHTQDIQGLADTLLLTGAGERKKELKDKLRLYVSSERFNVAVIRDSFRDVLGIRVIESVSDDELKIAFLRVRPGELSETLFRHLIDQSVLHADSLKKSVLYALASDFPTRRANEFTDAGFIKAGDVWVKLNYSFCSSVTDILEWLSQLPSKVPAVSDHVKILTRHLREQSTLMDWDAVERLIWPGRIVDVEIPCFIVPIRPAWAKQLFDSDLARQDLFGAEASLALCHENVYYRSARPTGGLIAPARILWYVSKGSGRDVGAMSIRACSSIEEVQVGKPKTIFKRFRRLGVYRWSHLSKITAGDITKDVMAIRFGRTNEFRTPVAWKEIQRTLENLTGKGNPLVSPVRVAADVFAALYRKGQGANEDGIVR
jgi:GNAT superfamily N-acetyltransferase